MQQVGRVFFLGVSVLQLVSCVSGDYSKSPEIYDTRGLYPQEAYSNFSDYQPFAHGHDVHHRVVHVPHSYHMDETHAPVSFKERDRIWVSSQNAQSYTIELSADAQPELVARKLSQAPSAERKAQVESIHNGQVYYRGVYGSYSSEFEAQKALNTLSPDLRTNAHVTRWESVR